MYSTSGVEVSSLLERQQEEPDKDGSDLGTKIDRHVLLVSADFECSVQVARLSPSTEKG